MHRYTFAIGIIAIISSFLIYSNFASASYDEYESEEGFLIVPKWKANTQASLPWASRSTEIVADEKQKIHYDECAGLNYTLSPDPTDKKLVPLTHENGDFVMVNYDPLPVSPILSSSSSSSTSSSSIASKVSSRKRSRDEFQKSSPTQKKFLGEKKALVIPFIKNK